MIIQNKKGLFSTSDFIVAMLIFSGVIALLVIAVGSMASDYENTQVVNEDFANKFNKFEDNTKTAAEMWNATTGEGGLKIIGTAELLFFSTFQVISLIFSSVGEAGAQLFGIGSFFGIPTVVSGIFFVLIFAILTVIIIFQILSFVKGGRDL